MMFSVLFESMRPLCSDVDITERNFSSMPYPQEYVSLSSISCFTREQHSYYRRIRQLFQ